MLAAIVPVPDGTIPLIVISPLFPVFVDIHTNVYVNDVFCPKVGWPTKTNTSFAGFPVIFTPVPYVNRNDITVFAAENVAVINNDIKKVPKGNTDPESNISVTDVPTVTASVFDTELLYPNCVIVGET